MSAARVHLSAGRVVAWAVVGATVGLGVVSLLTWGIVLLVAAAALTGILVWRTTPHSTEIVLGGATGLAVVSLFVAWLNRHGPGEVCVRTAGEGLACVEEWSPWPFVVLAVVIVAAGVLVSTWLGRSSRHSAPAL